MRLTKTKGIMTALLCSALLLGACTDKDADKGKDTDTKTQVTEDSSIYNDFMVKFVNKLENGEVVEATKLMTDQFEKGTFSQKETSTVLDAYIYGLSLKSAELNDEITDYHPQIKAFLAENKSFLSQDAIDTIEDEKFKDFAQRAYDNFLVLYAINDEYSLSPDITYVLSEYDDKMLPIFKDYLIVYNKVSQPIEYNESLDSLLGAVEVNINLLQGYLDTYNKNAYKDYDETINDYYINRAAQDILTYYETFFGLSTEAYLNEDETYKDEVIAYYEDLVENGVNPVLKEKTREILNRLKEDNNKMSTDMYKKIDDVLKVLDDNGSFIMNDNINEDYEKLGELKAKNDEIMEAKNPVEEKKEQLLDEQIKSGEAKLIEKQETPTTGQDTIQIESEK